MMETKDNKMKEKEVKIENQKKEIVDLASQRDEIKILLKESEENRQRCTESLSFFMTENQKLKNLLKVEDRELMEIAEEDEAVGKSEEKLENKNVIEELRDDMEKFKRFICHRVDKLTEMLYDGDDSSSSTTSTQSPTRSEHPPTVVAAKTPEQFGQHPPVITVPTPCPEPLTQLSQPEQTGTPSPELLPRAGHRIAQTEPDTHLIPGTRRNQTNINSVLTTSSCTIHPSGTAYIPSKNDVTLKNNFHNLQYMSNNNQQSDVIPVVPGTQLYSSVVGGSRKATVFSTSMTRDFDMIGFRRPCKSDVNLHKYNGKKARHFKTYVTAHLPEDKPDDVIIQCGGNDLPTKASVREIANEIIETGIVCRTMGVHRVMISSILPRGDFHLQLKRQELNQLLESLCEINKFIFIKNKTMVLSRHLDHDGVHLNDEGTKLLQETFVRCLNANV